LRIFAANPPASLSTSQFAEPPFETLEPPRVILTFPPFASLIMRFGVLPFTSNPGSFTMHLTRYRSLAAAGLLAGALVALSACDKKTAADASPNDTTAASGADAMTTNKDRSRAFVEEVINKGNAAAIDEYITPDFVEHTAPPGEDSTIAGLRKWVSEMHTGMPDGHVEIVNLWADGDYVIMHTRQTGTNSGPMMGMPATNKKMDVRGVDIIKIKDGKATDHWGYYEEMKMAKQLGMLPDMPMPGTANAPKGADTAAKQ
jgi:steroid delta-isomerase-like uncharacterized protein